MAGTRGRLRKANNAPTPRRSLRKRDTQDEERDGLPDAVREMLHEERTAKRVADDEEKPPKKRKTAHAPKSSSPGPVPQVMKLSPESAIARPSKPAPSSLPPSLLPYEPPTHNAPSQQPHRVRQTIEDSDESEDDSDMEWEDALGDGDDSESESKAKAPPQIGDISITIGGKKSNEVSAKTKVRRRAITSVDRRKRLDIHKMHILCLLYHVHRRNAWCNDARVQSALRKLVEPKTLTSLVPNPDLTQYSASKRFIDALNDLKIMWSKRFKATAQGMSKPKWAEPDAEVRPFSDFDELDSPMDKDDFRTSARTLQGSCDVGGQLFCALLRGIGVEARLVCSLQELPFASAAQPSTPQKPTQAKTITIDPYNKGPVKSPAPVRNKKLSRLERIMGERHPVLNKAGTGPKKQKAFHTPYPVYWVEAFNAAHQKWVPIDPLSTFTINSPEKLEPPFSYLRNSLTYALAFEEDYSAHDVTRRYAKAYNAKTLKFRVESTSRGPQWWTRSLKYFTRPSPLPRDATEEASLARKVAAEGIPKNVQDFKNHPVYVLERHLRHNEVIHPLDVVGKVNVGSAMNPRMESIHRRKNVHTVRSADKWYRMGRDVLPGEQPLKHAKPKKNRLPSIGPDERLEDVAEEIGAALYANFQTEIYVPPPVVRGRVPRNAYGNLDLYVPSMVPPGGVHVRHKLASKAARLLQIDYADAVTGFQFKGRHGTAVVQGCVVAIEYADAVEQTIEGFEYLQVQAEVEARSAESLRLWRRFYLGLRIAQRVNAIEIDGQRGDLVDVQKSIDYEEQRRQADAMAGGFLAEDATYVEPGRPGRPDVVIGGVFVPDDEGGGVRETEDGSEAGDHGGGGFIPADDHENSDFELAGPSLNREESFGSVILESQDLRPRRRSSFGEPYVSSDASTPRQKSTDDSGEESEWEDPAGFEKMETGVELLERAAAQSDDVTGGRDMGGGFFRLPTGSDIDSGTHDALSAPKEQLKHNSEHVVLTRAEVKAAPTEDEVSRERPPDSSLKSDISDTGSLLLEDPDDEDAEPDWI